MPDEAEAGAMPDALLVSLDAAHCCTVVCPRCATYRANPTFLVYDPRCAIRRGNPALLVYETQGHHWGCEFSLLTTIAGSLSLHDN